VFIGGAAECPEQPQPHVTTEAADRSIEPAPDNRQGLPEVSAGSSGAVWAYMVSLGVQSSKEWAGVSGRILHDNGCQFGTGASDARRDRAEGWRQSEGGKPGGKRGGKGVQKGKGNRWHSAVSRF